MAKTVWLLGAGFSRPLGGPLFDDLLSHRVERWVRAWTLQNAHDVNLTPQDCPKIYEKGRRLGLWKDAEECISLFDDARENRVTREVVQAALHEEEARDLDPKLVVQPPVQLDVALTRLTLFVAVATSHFIPDDNAPLPEAWDPYERWARTLTSDDVAVSFNYDRVFETLKARVSTCKGELIKLHGSAPDRDDLVVHLKNRTPIETFCIPGPAKLARAQSDLSAAWQSAKDAIAAAERLIVIGYSFPASDATTRSLVLKHCRRTTNLAVVLGPGEHSAGVMTMFRHLGTGAVNTQQLAQQYLAEGTALSGDENRFAHELTWPWIENFRRAMDRSR